MLRSNLLSRALPLGVLAAAVCAPGALAVPDCYPYCDPPPEDHTTPPTAVFNAPATAKRNGIVISVDAIGSRGGTNSAGEANPITKVRWNLDGETGNGF